ncbi:hypothetical protein BURMUCGD1_3037 [Burkholderia multivorans CGD1]|nr:hypothetical protein BURMUCGD1_3037 [Burkholderia multivorans CGD1]
MEPPADSCHCPVHLAFSSRPARARAPPISTGPPPPHTASTDPGRCLAFFHCPDRRCY